MSAPMAQDIEQEFDRIRDIEFLTDPQKGFLDRALAEVEFTSDLVIVPPFGYQINYPLLSDSKPDSSARVDRGAGSSVVCGIVD
jgi:hypothetical protein